MLLLLTTSTIITLHPRQKQEQQEQQQAQQPTTFESELTREFLARIFLMSETQHLYERFVSMILKISEVNSFDREVYSSPAVGVDVSSAVVAVAVAVGSVTDDQG